MDNTKNGLHVDSRKVTDLLEMKLQIEKLTESQKMFLAGAIAALRAKPEKK